MTIVLVSGWNAGFEKVRFTFLLQSSMGYSLSRAKRVTDSILENSDIALQVEDAQMDDLLSSMRNLGVRCAVAVGHR